MPHSMESSYRFFDKISRIFYKLIIISEVNQQRHTPTHTPNDEINLRKKLLACIIYLDKVQKIVLKIDRYSNIELASMMSTGCIAGQNSGIV